jgi:hypothetical protein
MIAGALVTLALCTLLVAGLLMRLATRHEPVRTERGALAGSGTPLDVVQDAYDMGWNGDTLTWEVCACGAARQIGTSRWNHVFCRTNSLIRTVIK